jgi:AraC-like DNA-binding protein
VAAATQRLVPGVLDHLCAVVGQEVLAQRRFPGRDVEAVRLESACRLLETTNRSIEQIARTCGFGTPGTMNRTFRRRLNTTPGAHRHHFRGTLSVPSPAPCHRREG